MLNTFLATLSPMMVMVVCILIGFLLRKFRLMPENSAAVLSKLEIYVLLPARVLSSFLTYCTVESILSQYKVVLYSAVATVLAVAMGIPLARLFSKKRDERVIYQYSLMIANFGYLGNAIVPEIMGDAALYSYMLYSLPLNIMLYSWAFHTLVPEEKRKHQSVFRKLMNPTMIAMIVGLILGISGLSVHMPGFVTASMKNLSGCMGPVSMILTGFIIGGYDIGGLLKNKRVYIVTFLRLIVLPCILVAVLWLLGADKTTLLLTLIAFGSALGLNTVVVPAAYDGDTRTGASMAMISHVLAGVTIPLLYALLTRIL